MGQAAAGGISIMGLGMQMAGTVSEGIQKKTAAQIDSIKLKMAAEAGKVRAIQTDAAYREELDQTMQNISAIRSAQSVGFDSPTAFAIYDKARETNAQARMVAVSNERLKALGLEGDATAAWQRGQMARTASGVKLAGQALSAGQKIADLAKGLGE
jgi:hypothetical protein